MKKMFIMLLLVGLFLTSTSVISAQQYFYYNTNQDGPNIMLTYQGNSLEISFSSGDEWYTYQFQNYVNKDSSRPGKGWTCTISFDDGTVYKVDYFRTTDMIVLTNNRGSKWNLKRQL